VLLPLGAHDADEGHLGSICLEGVGACKWDKSPKTTDSESQITGSPACGASAPSKTCLLTPSVTHPSIRTADASDRSRTLAYRMTAIANLQDRSTAVRAHPIAGPNYGTPARMSRRSDLMTDGFYRMAQS
jgi:hypothetical protein